MLSKKVLITGGAGYIGSTLTPFLLEKGYHVTVVDNLMFNQNSLSYCCKYKNFEFFNQDISNIDFLKTIIGRFDFFIPLAALVGAPLCEKDPQKTKIINSESHIKLFESLPNDIKIIFPSTNSGYGKSIEGEYCNENSKVNPLSEYGKFKLEIENLYLRREKSIIFRFATIFGSSPRMRMDLLVNDFVYRAYKDKSITIFESEFRRNFLHIQDAVKVFYFAIRNFDKMKTQIFNVGLSSANLTKMELALKIKEFFPEFYIHCSEFKSDPDQRDYLVSNEKIEKLGWKPEFSLDDGIKELRKLYSIIKVNNYSNI